MIKHSYHLLKTDWIALTSAPFWMFNIFSTEKKFALKKNDMSEQSLNISLNTFHPHFVYGCKNNISFILFLAARFFFISARSISRWWSCFVSLYHSWLFQKTRAKSEKLFSKPKRKFANSFKFWQPICTAFKFEKLLKGKHNKFPCDFNSQLKKTKKCLSNKFNLKNEY